MRSTIALLAAVALAAITFAGEPRIQSVAEDEGPLAIGAYRVFTVKDYTGDRTKLRWEPEAVYEIGYKDGKPVLISGEVDLLNILKPAAIPRQKPLGLVDVEPGAVVAWGTVPGKVRLVVRGAVDGVPTRLDTIVLTVGKSDPPAIDPVPIDPQPGDKVTFWFVLARENGPATEEVRKVLAMPSWADATKAGHKFKDLTRNEIKLKNGKDPLAGTTLPCILVFRSDDPTGDKVSLPLPWPKSDGELKRLLEVKP